MKDPTGSLTFTGFSTESFVFFKELAHNNRKAWLDAHRSTYEEHVLHPMKSLFASLVPVVMELDPNFEVSGRSGRNFSRINRDIRFSRDKSPYRKNLYLFFADRDKPGRQGRLYVGLSADGVTCGFATYHLPRGTMDRLLKPRRQRQPDGVERIARGLKRRYQMYWHGTVRGAWTKYPGYPRDDTEWKRCKAWVVRKLFPPSHRDLASARFARTASAIFRELFPLYAFSTLEGARYDTLRPLR